MGLCAFLLYRVRSVLTIAVFFPTIDANLFWGNLAVKSQASVNLLWKIRRIYDVMFQKCLYVFRAKIIVQSILLKVMGKILLTHL